VSAIAKLAYQCAQGLTDPRSGQSTPLGAASKVQFLGQDQEDPERVLAVLADVGLVTAPPQPTARSAAGLLGPALQAGLERFARP
jgi:hypothetical protein